MKLFADMERKRRELANRDMEERKRKREQELEEEEKANTEKEWQKNFEVHFPYTLLFLKKYFRSFHLSSSRLIIHNVFKLAGISPKQG